VVCLDVDEARVEQLKRGRMPIYEPGLEEMARRNVAGERLRFSASYEEAVHDAEFIFICVDTPSGATGEADLRYVREAARMIADVLDHDVVIVNRSTVPIGTGDVVASIVGENSTRQVKVSVVSNPEFTREGSAIQDFLSPDRIVLGATNGEAAQSVAKLYLPLRAPMMVTDLRTAEMIKYASNAFLATRVSFINEIASICERVGADVVEVAAGMGYDRRIGPDFLDAGLGWGGSCFPKDVHALEHIASIHGSHPQLLRAVMEINRDQRRQVIHRLRDVLGSLRGRTVALLGLAFKPNTDDMRGAPSVELAHLLRSEGAHVKGYDPVANENARRWLPDVQIVSDAYEAAEGADALIVVTEWNEFKNLDLRRVASLMRRPVIVDGRNIYEPAHMEGLGFIYRGVGRGGEAPAAVDSRGPGDGASVPDAVAPPTLDSASPEVMAVAPAEAEA
jgi:UDPglucose 6-dehydrogenase